MGIFFFLRGGFVAGISLMIWHVMCVWTACWALRYCSLGIHPGSCKSTCMNSMQTGIMPCATFRTVPFQKSSSHSFAKYPIRIFRALVLSKAHANAKYFSTKAAQYKGSTVQRQHRQQRCLAERVSFGGRGGRCLAFSPLPCPALPK
jgi:hypothetical protein